MEHRTSGNHGEGMRSAGVRCGAAVVRGGTTDDVACVDTHVFSFAWMSACPYVATVRQEVRIRTHTHTNTHTMCYVDAIVWVYICVVACRCMAYVFACLRVLPHIDPIYRQTNTHTHTHTPHTHTRTHTRTHTFRFFCDQQTHTNRIYIRYKYVSLGPCIYPRLRVSTRVSTRVSWRMCVSVCLGAHVTALHLRAPRAAVDLRVLGSQAFLGAKAFNANIGAWNTASVSNMFWVCAVFHTDIHMCAQACPRAHLCVRFGAHASTPRFRALRAAVDFRFVGSQAFYVATAFNANIGAWNTALVSNMHQVCRFGKMYAFV
jgi:hypothetical protein